MPRKKPKPRGERFAFRASDDEAKMIERLAELDAVSASDAIRLAVRHVFHQRLPNA